MDLSVTKNTWGRRQYGTVYGSVGHKKYVGQKTIWYSLWICRSQKILGAEDNMVQFMDLSVTNNTWVRRQYSTVYGSVGHKKYVARKTIWYSLWIYRSQKIRGAEDNMVQFMDLSVTKKRGAEDNMVQFMDLSVTNNTWHRRQYGIVYGSIGHKKYVGQKTIWYSLWICRS